MSGLIRDRVMMQLPVNQNDLMVRLCTRKDYNDLARWPPYQWPYDVFNLRFSKMSKAELDMLYEERLEDQSRVTLVAELSGAVVGYTALLEIDWLRGTSENMAVRLHPDYTDRGYGTDMLNLVRDWWFRYGMKKLRLDVAASNHRAVRCYTNASFTVVNEFWREAPDLLGVDLDDPKYDFLREHLKHIDNVPQIRFYWMEKVETG